MSRLKHKKAIILAVIVVVMIGLVTGVALIKKSQTEISKTIDLDSKLDYQYLTKEKWFQKLGKVQIY